ncbi:MAG: (4Fe-4S)-binding protein [Dehalococcoidia bacterium]
MTSQHDVKDVKKEHRTDRIAVTWEPTYCIHAQNCVRGLPTVFNWEDRPWIHPDAASPDKIAQVIMTCPSGALHFRRLDDGPLVMRGDLEIREVAAVATRYHRRRCDGTGQSGLRIGGN